MYHYREVKEICNKARENGRTLPIFKKYGNDEYFSLKNKLKKLGFNDSDASIVLSSIDDFGACSYAAICNTIFNKFRKRPDLFEEAFGYSMYRKDNGKLKLNSSELLLDLYLFANDKRNGGKFFYTNANGGKNIDSIYKANVIDSVGRSILNGKEQFFFISDNNNNDEMINNFLKSKSSKLEYYGNYIFRNAFCSNRKPLNDIELHYVIQTIKNEIKRGKALGLYVAHDENFPVTFSAMDKNVSDVSTANWNEGGAHDVGIIGINKDGLIVSSWGNKYLISFSDLANGRINIHSCDIKLV